MRVVFSRQANGSSVAVIDRPDGVRLRLDAYDRVMPVPHDLAHLAAERAFRLTGGVWGSIASGAMFASMSVVSGRVRHDRAQRSAAVLAAHARELGLAENLAGLLLHGTGLPPHGRSIPVARARRELDGVWQAALGTSCPAPDSVLPAAVDELAALGERYRALAGDETLELDWPFAPRKVAVPAHSGRRPPRSRR